MSTYRFMKAYNWNTNAIKQKDTQTHTASVALENCMFCCILLITSDKIYLLHIEIEERGTTLTLSLNHVSFQITVIKLGS